MNAPSPVSPFDDPEAFDTFIVFSPAGKTTFPGVNFVTVSAGIEEDQEKIPGGDGSKKTLLGYSDKEVVVTNLVWTTQQYNKIKEIVRLYQPVRGEKPVELTAVHPTLSIYKIDQLYIFKIETDEFVSNRPYQTVFRMREWQSKIIQKETKEIGGNSVDAEGTDLLSIPTTNQRPSNDIPDSSEAWLRGR